MADATTLVVMENGFKNVTLRFSDVSDGTGLSGFVLYDGTSGGPYGVQIAGQTLYPGLHSKIMMADYDVQDMKIRLQWDATTPQDVLVFGNAPEDFDFRDIGGLAIPPGLVGATGKLLISTISAAANSTCQLVLRLVKDIHT